MRTMHTMLAAALVGALLLGGCGKDNTPPKPTPGNGNPVGTKEPKHPELVAPFEGALQALLDMNETGRSKDFVAAEKHFRAFREHWAKIRETLKTEDPKLEVHIEDGAVELDYEFKKPANEIRVYELDEETVKLGRLLSGAAEDLGVPIREELVQKDPTADVPFNKEVRYEITLVDHKIEPKVIELEQHTKVTFVITNRGREVHEFEMGHYAVEVEDLQPGQTKELTLVLLDAGEFETSCHVPGHYEVGMHGTLKVKPAKLQAR